jgi:hypothetical protein
MIRTSLRFTMLSCVGIGFLRQERREPQHRFDPPNPSPPISDTAPRMLDGLPPPSPPASQPARLLVTLRFLVDTVEKGTPMKTSGRSESELLKSTLLLPVGDYDGECREAAEGLSRNNNARIETVWIVRDADGNEREFHDYLTDVGRGALKLRRACAAVGAIGKYEAAAEITPADFVGQVCRLKIGIEKRRGWPDRNVIEDYAPADVSVVRLRAAS